MLRTTAKYSDITEQDLADRRVQGHWGAVKVIDFVSDHGGYLNIHYHNGTASLGQSLDYVFLVTNPPAANPLED